nr:hypothetical protein [Tanacetum cinerariifolium]
MLNSRTRKLMSTLLKARVSCDTIQERKIEKANTYAELERKCNDALHDLDNNPLVLDMRAEIETLQGQVDRLYGLESEREKLKCFETQLLQEIARMRCIASEEVASFKEPFDLEKMLGYYPSSKEKFDQAGDDLATAFYPFIAKATADPYAFLEVFLLKKPKSLHAKPPPLTSKPSSSNAFNPDSKHLKENVWKRLRTCESKKLVVFTRVNCKNGPCGLVKSQTLRLVAYKQSLELELHDLQGGLFSWKGSRSTDQRSQGFGCSPIQVVRELGLERRETVRSHEARRPFDDPTFDVIPFCSLPIKYPNYSLSNSGMDHERFCLEMPIRNSQL